MQLALSSLRSRGYAVVGPVDEAGFRRLACALGDVVDETAVKIVAGKRTYLAQAGPIPLHTDHPVATHIAWRCEEQDARDGASLLVDGREALDSLPEATQAALRSVELPAAVRTGETITPTAIARGEGRIFYAPWLEPLVRTEAVREALVAWRAAIEAASVQVVRLRKGEVLVVDNHRMLHGRAALLEDSARCLRRLWIAAGRQGL